jgi:hypothetical protein
MQVAVEHRLDQCSLGAEVVQNARVGESDLGGDGCDGRALEPAAAEQLGRRVDDLRDRDLGRAPLSAGLRPLAGRGGQGPSNRRNESCQVT